MIKKIIKRIFMRWIGSKLGSLGHDSYLSPTCRLITPKQIFVGNKVYIGEGAYISAHKGIYIGDGVIIGPQFLVMGGDINFRKVGYRNYQVNEEGINKPIIIEDDVWIGARVAILKGVKVGEGAIIGTGSIVTKNIKPYTIVAGNPARKIGERFGGEELIRHLQLINSKYHWFPAVVSG